MFKKTWEEFIVLERWPQAQRLIDTYNSHTRKWETFMTTRVAAVRLNDIFNPTQKSAPQHEWWLRLYTIKPGGKRFVLRDSIPIPPIQEDLETMSRPIQPEIDNRSTDELVTELQSMGGFVAIRSK